MMTTKTVGFGLGLLLLPASSFGLGLRAFNQDAFATGRGSAVVATADNPSAVYYNPAGISQLEGVQLRGGLYGIYIDDQYRDFNGTRYDTESNIGLLPQVYGTWSIKDSPFTVGLGLYCPYGLSLEWPETAPFGAVGQRGTMKYITIEPELSWKICNTLSLGAGPTFNISQISFYTQQPPQPPYVPGPYELRFKGDDFAVGATVGLLWTPHPKHALGFSYRSPTTMNYDGNWTALGSTMPAQAQIRFPQNFIVGYSFRPTPRWNLEFDVDWTDWSSKTITLNPPQMNPQYLNWQSSLVFEWGATYYFDKGFRASGGFIYSQNSVPSSSFNPVIPDSDRYVFTVGFGQAGKHFTWDLAYQFGYGPSRTINTFDFLGGGSYTYYSHDFSISVGYKF
jgi:long-chain fatty acid transport protein